MDVERTSYACVLYMCLVHVSVQVVSANVLCESHVQESHRNAPYQCPMQILLNPSFVLVLNRPLSKLSVQTSHHLHTIPVLSLATKTARQGGLLECITTTLQRVALRRREPSGMQCRQNHGTVYRSAPAMEHTMASRRWDRSRGGVADRRAVASGVGKAGCTDR